MTNPGDYTYIIGHNDIAVVDGGACGSPRCGWVSLCGGDWSMEQGQAWFRWPGAARAPPSVPRTTAPGSAGALIATSRAGCTSARL